MADLIADRDPTIDREIFDPARFGDVDPTTIGFRELCAAARSRKSRDRVGGPGTTPP